MLANRHAPEKIPEIMEHSRFVIEKKFDGERIQAHRVGNTVRYFSRYTFTFIVRLTIKPSLNLRSWSLFELTIVRNANDVTQQYGPYLTEHLLKALKTDKCILDGELLLWDAVANRFEEFGSLRCILSPSTPFLSTSFPDFFQPIQSFHLSRFSSRFLYSDVNSNFFSYSGISIAMKFKAVKRLLDKTLVKDLGNTLVVPAFIPSLSPLFCVVFVIPI